MLHLLVLWFLVPMLWDRVKSTPASIDGDAVPTARGTPVTTTEVRIYRLAARQAGVATVSDVVVEVGCSVAAAEDILQGMVDGERVRMDVESSGKVRYQFPELMSRNEKARRPTSLAHE